MLNRSTSLWVLSLSTLLLTAGSVVAAPIAAPGLIATPSEPYGGAVVGGPLVAPFATPPGPGAFSGTLTSTVLAGDPFNPYGGLTFVYKVALDAGSSPIERLTNIDFTGILTDVSYSGAGVAPDTTSRAIAATIGWNYSLGLLGGGVSADLVVQTDAAGFRLSQGNLIDGQVVSTAALGPDGRIIPEPAAIGLLGAASLLALRRRK